MCLTHRTRLTVGTRCLEWAGRRSERRGADTDPAREHSIRQSTESAIDQKVDSLDLVGAHGAIAVRVINPHVQDTAMRERNGERVAPH